MAQVFNNEEIINYIVKLYTVKDYTVVLDFVILFLCLAGYEYPLCTGEISVSN